MNSAERFQASTNSLPASLRSYPSVVQPSSAQPQQQQNFLSTSPEGSGSYFPAPITNTLSLGEDLCFSLLPDRTFSTNPRSLDTTAAAGNNNRSSYQGVSLGSNQTVAHFNPSSKVSDMPPQYSSPRKSDRAFMYISRKLPGHANEQRSLAGQGEELPSGFLEGSPPYGIGVSHGKEFPSHATQQLGSTPSLSIVATNAADGRHFASAHASRAHKEKMGLYRNGTACIVGTGDGAGMGKNRLHSMNDIQDKDEDLLIMENSSKPRRYRHYHRNEDSSSTMGGAIVGKGSSGETDRGVKYLNTIQESVGSERVQGVSGSSVKNGENSNVQGNSSSLKTRYNTDEVDVDNTGRKRMVKPNFFLLDANEKRNEKALDIYALPWDQRSMFPVKTYDRSAFQCCTTPKFWEKVDWTLRCAFLCQFIVGILCIPEYSTRLFYMPIHVMFLALWITAPTLGAGLKECFNTVKGFAWAVIINIITVYVRPGPIWLWLIFLFVQVMLICCIANTLMKNGSYAMISVMQAYYVNNPRVDMKWLGQLSLSCLEGIGIGLISFFIPWPVLALNSAKRDCGTLGNVLSVCVQGICRSFWTTSVFQRELNLVKIRLMRETFTRCTKALDSQFFFATYEPVSGRQFGAVKIRYKLLKQLVQVVRSLSILIEDICANPDIINNPTSMMIEKNLREPVTMIASAIDTMLLKIIDPQHHLCPTDYLQLEMAFAQFMEDISNVRQDFILSNEVYKSDVSDIDLGFFLFSLARISNLLTNFREPETYPSTAKIFLLAPIEWVKHSWESVVYLVRSFRHGILTRRVKEAIKLAGSMTVCSGVLMYTGQPDPIAGAALIPWVYQRTGGDSFTYSLMRAHGTVFGSVLAFIGAELANEKVVLLILSFTILSVVGGYIQTSVEYTAMGNTFLWAVTAISVRYGSRDGAAKRIQQNMFAIAIYFIVSQTVFPKQAIFHIKMELDACIRSFKDAAFALLHGLEDPDGAENVLAAVDNDLDDMENRIAAQEGYLYGAVKEPTLAGLPFPEDQWSQLICTMQSLSSLLRMMRLAFATFIQSRTERSIHWRLVEVIAEGAADIGDLLTAQCDLYLMILNNAFVVPTSFLIRLRLNILDCSKELEKRFCAKETELVQGVGTGDANYSDGNNKNTDGNQNMKANKNVSPDYSHANNYYNDQRYPQNKNQGGFCDNQCNVQGRNGGLRSPTPPFMGGQSHDGFLFPSQPDSMVPYTKGDDVKGMERRCSEGWAYMNENSMALRADQKGNIVQGLPIGESETETAALSGQGTGFFTVDMRGMVMSQPRYNNERGVSPEHTIFSNVNNFINNMEVLDGEKKRIQREMLLKDDDVDGLYKGLFYKDATATSQDDDEVLTNEDVHSVEAFIFGIRAILLHVGNFEKELLEMKHATEINKKL